jgi:hypothetical protein
MKGGIGRFPAVQEAEVHGPECFLLIFPEWMIGIAYEPVLLYVSLPDVRSCTFQSVSVCQDYKVNAQGGLCLHCPPLMAEAGWSGSPCLTFHRLLLRRMF